MMNGVRFVAMRVRTQGSSGMNFIMDGSMNHSMSMVVHMKMTVPKINMAKVDMGRGDRSTCNGRLT